MANARASAASAGFGGSDNPRIRVTMVVICALSARPLPVNAFLTSDGVYMCTGSPRREAASISTPTAWAVCITVETLPRSKIRSMATTSGSYLSIHSSAAFDNRMAELGVEVDESHQISSDLTRGGGEVAMRLALESGLDFDVVVATSDVMALGALHEARRSGVRIPEEVGLTGFGDITSLRDVQPGLTTVRVPTDRLATLALDLALNGPGDGTGSQVVSVTPVVRDSTPPRT